MKIKLDDIPKSFVIPKHYRMFEVRYLSATDTKGSRLKIVDERNNKSKTLGRDYKYNVGGDQVIGYLHHIGIEVIGFATTDEKDFIFTSDFKTMLE